MNISSSTVRPARPFPAAPDPPAPEVTETNCGFQRVRAATSFINFAVCLSVFGGKNSKEMVMLELAGKWACGQP